MLQSYSPDTETQAHRILNWLVNVRDNVASKVKLLDTH